MSATQIKLVCYLLHTSVCYFSNKCAKCGIAGENRPTGAKFPMICKL